LVRERAGLTVEHGWGRVGASLRLTGLLLKWFEVTKTGGRLAANGCQSASPQVLERREKAFLRAIADACRVKEWADARSDPWSPCAARPGARRWCVRGALPIR